MSWQVWEVAETKISAGLSQVTPPAELIWMVQYLYLHHSQYWIKLSAWAEFVELNFSIWLLTISIGFNSQWNFSKNMHSWPAPLISVSSIDGWFRVLSIENEVLITDWGIVWENFYRCGNCWHVIDLIWALHFERSVGTYRYRCGNCRPLIVCW